MHHISYIALCSDMHIVEPGQKLMGLDTSLRAAALAKALRNEPVRLEFVACLGDLCDTVSTPNRGEAVATRSAYAHAREILGQLPAPLISLPGNHDHPAIMSEEFPAEWSSSHSGVSQLLINGTQVIGIDVRTGPEATGELSLESLRQLEASLHSCQRAIILSHNPLFSLDSPRCNSALSVTNRGALAPILERHRNKVLGLFHGHLHLWIAAALGGITSYCVPSASFGFSLEPLSSEREALSATPVGYLLVGLGDDGSLFVRPRFTG